MRFAGRLHADPPKYVSIEPSSKCNLHCIMCTRETLLQKPLNLNMDFNSFRHIVDQFVAPVEVLFCGVGEPLLHRQIVEMVRYIRDKGWRPTMITNGTIMTEETARQLITAGLTRITFSIHGGTPETHQLIRNGPERIDSIDRVMDNIRCFVRLRDELNANIYVMCNYLAAKQTIDEFPSTLQASKEIGIDEVVALRLINVNGNLDHLMPDHKQERQLIGYKKLAGELGVKFSFWEGAGRCRELWECIFIMSNGDVGPCDGWTYDKPAIGNLLREPLNDLWNGAEYRELRNTFLTRKLEWCKTCCLGGAFESPLELLVDKVRSRVTGLLKTGE